ncbi:MAG: 3-(methylthio)propionyl-CoA ligase [Rhodoferax sp.]|nr:3-(methylthio)propionyl-CoA ligase [Rhodoferax sp.]
MLGLMQSQPLLTASLIRHAERHHGDGEVISRRVEGDIHRTRYREVAARARQVAQALDALGLAGGDRVATLAWNGYRHLELYYGVSGSGRVLHTLNPRVHPDQLVWMANHAHDKVLCFDLSFLPIVQAVHRRCTSIAHFVVLCDSNKVPAGSGIPGLQSYERWIAPHPTDYEWPVLDEHAASSMCYTSGTTGDPKAVVYSHRSTVLHALSSALPDALNLSARDCVMPVVPMFHVHAWGLPYAAVLTGAKLVFPGPAMDGKSLHDLMEAEQVTLAAGVPTVWHMLLSYLHTHQLRLRSLRRAVIGGAPCSPAMLAAFRVDHGVEVVHAWGMTEMSPLGTVSAPKHKHLAWPDADQARLTLTQGRAVFGVDMKIVDEQDAELPWDGVQAGELMVRGPWVLCDYYRDPGVSPVTDGWFRTGDVATIDADGFMRIMDRRKDIIKSGGEWISSIDIENVAQGHPAVGQAACIGVPHPKWNERPILVVVLTPGCQASRDDILAYFDGKAPKWQVPDDVVFVASIPVSGTGKMQKATLRDQLKGYRLPGT